MSSDPFADALRAFDRARAESQQQRARIAALEASARKREAVVAQLHGENDEYRLENHGLRAQNGTLQRNNVALQRDADEAHAVLGEQRKEMQRLKEEYEARIAELTQQREEMAKDLGRMADRYGARPGPATPGPSKMTSVPFPFTSKTEDAKPRQPPTANPFKAPRASSTQPRMNPYARPSGGSEGLKREPKNSAPSMGRPGGFRETYHDGRRFWS